MEELEIMVGVLKIVTILEGCIIAALIAMYINKREELKDNEITIKDYNKIQQQIYINQTEASNAIDNLKRQYQERLTKGEEIEKILKALINKFKNEEIEIAEKDIKEADSMNLYIDNSYLKCAKKIKVLHKDKCFKLKEETEE